MKGGATYKMNKIGLKKIAITNIAFMFTAMAVPFFAQPAEAVRMNQAYLRLDRMKAATTTSGMVCGMPSTTNLAQTEASVQVTFPSGFTVDTTASNWTVTTTDLPSGASAWPGIATATAVSGQTVTFPSSDLSSASTLYCFNFSGTSTLTNGSAGDDQTGTIVTRTSAPATIDSTSYATSIVSDDQIVVTASIDQIFGMLFSGNTVALGTLTPGTIAQGSVTTTIDTNATDGWIAWVKSTNAALSSAATGESIATVGSVDNTTSDLASTTGYVLDVDITTDSTTGTGTVTQASNFGAEYAATGTCSGGGTAGGTLSTTFQPIAASDGTTDGDVLTICPRVKVDAGQAPASDYTDTLTVVAAGRF